MANSLDSMMNNNLPKVTVLTTVYNGMPYLKQAIDSTLEQTFTDFEFLIIDDASTDESLQCIRSYNDSRIKLVCNEVNMGQTASLNKGLAIAKGEYIVRLDQDDVNLPKRIEEQLDLFFKNQALTIVCSWEHTIDSDGKLVRDWVKSIPDYGVFLGEILLGLCPVWHPSVMFRKKDILNLNGFDISYGPAEDYELWSRIAMARLNAAIAPQFHLLQRVHNSRQSLLQADKQLKSTVKAHTKVVENFSNSNQIACISAILRLEKDPCGMKYNVSHINTISLAISDMLDNICQNLSLTDLEFISLKNTLAKRIGKGVLNAHRFSKLPKPFFYLLFYSLSPLLLPGLRAILSKVNSKLKKIRYTFSS